MIDKMKSRTDNSADGRFKERFEFALKRVGTLEVAGSLVGTSAEQVARWRDEKAKAPFLAIAILAEAAGVTAEWLAFGREAKAASPDEGKGEDGNVVFVPVLNVVGSAGNGAVNDQVRVVNRLPFSRSLLREFGVRSEAAHFIHARGDSMEPAITDGAIVLIDSSVRRIRDDGIYALVVDGDVRIKRVQKGINGIILRSDNPRYADEFIADIDQVRIEGKVFWAGSRI